jgi:SAM-dependent methyltransferase
MSERTLRDEFNSWADAGRGERMARGHRPATEQAIALLDVAEGHRALDLGCGIGWAVRLMAARCAAGEAVGIDVSDKMIERARASADNPSNVRFEVATAERLPFDDAYFDRVISVESLYYYDDPKAALAEVARVTKPGGRLAVLVDFYAENVESHHWADEIAVPMHLLSTREYQALMTGAGFGSFEVRRLFDPSPLPARDAFEPTWGFRTWEQLARYREEGTLFVMATRNP